MLIYILFEVFHYFWCSMIVGELFTKYKEDHVDSNVKEYKDMLKRLDEYGQLLRETAKNRIESSIADCDENARELARVSHDVFLY